jgi:uncharacterized protein YbcV (DUF1398 family)
MMNTRTLSECTQLSLAGQITFPEVVKRLTEIGTERYYADLVRMEKVYYSSQGDVHIEKLLLMSSPKIADEFNETGVMETLKKIQKGEINYQEFLKQIMANGTAGYTVFINGARTIYHGRKGEQHIELFP